MMKLTQKTIFQCFDKSQKQSPIVINEKDDGMIKKHLKINLLKLAQTIRKLVSPLMLTL